MGDPAADEFDLGRRHLAIGLGRRHLLVGVMRQQTLQDLALLRLAGDDRGDAFVGLDRVIADVKPQAGLAVLRVLTVAVEAVLREDRPDVAVEADVLGGEARQRSEK